MAAALPGRDLIRAGLEALARGNYDAPEAILLQTATQRLGRLGFKVPPRWCGGAPAYAEYDLLRALDARGVADANGRLRALLAELVSFESAAEAHVRRIAQRAPRKRRTTG
ncbi:MAG: hypothetical protein QJR02_03660 [Sinobacteraceae bacterium]|nr:hypothetical protein [Nevskiaceae bacterium]